MVCVTKSVPQYRQSSGQFHVSSECDDELVDRAEKDTGRGMIRMGALTHWKNLSRKREPNLF